MIIEIPGNPISKQRARVKFVNGRVWTFDPQENEKKAVTYKIMFQAGEIIVDEESSFHVVLELYLPYPKSLGVGAHNKLSWSPKAIGKPDIDNLAKFYLDCANGILWTDDKQIVSLNILKKYSLNPRTIIKAKKEERMELDEGAIGIMSLFSKEQFDKLTVDLRELGNLGSNPSKDDESDSEFAMHAVLMISRLADEWSRDLAKVAKKYPNYWKESRFSDGKVI